ncbi:hypothetical protein FD754_020792 [Muntiacus muntjak]|uniref:RNA-directed DNA polymerase n=1 Tax=Muntiacus muntjak TaxID=9888 RepID=A0A5N3V3Y3_MUNMU|nr:hypothetical protein FD754_020792 [Muntiacus muntjak]
MTIDNNQLSGWTENLQSTSQNQTCTLQKGSWPLFGVRCIDPPVLDSMKLKGVIKRHYYPGDRIDYECYRGYFYVWPYLLSATCEPNGSWSRIEEACLRKSCPDPKVKHGKVVAPNETFEWESEAHISCDEGYFLRGKPIIVCNLIGENVSWSDTIPHCEKIYCGQPPKIKHGKHTNSYRNIFEYNELITYSCDLSNGPDEYSLVGQSKLVCIEPNKWSSDPPLCKVVKCERPFLEHGIMVSGSREKFSYQSVVVFECLQGFYLNGSNLVFCGGNDTWEPEIPTCIKVFLPPPSFPSHTIIIFLKVMLKILQAKIGHGTIEWFKIGKGVQQGYVLMPCLFNFYEDHIMQNARLDESQAGIEIAEKSINNLRYADDTTLMVESEEELKSLLVKLKEESKKAGLKFNIQKTNILASGLTTSWQIEGVKVEAVTDFIFFSSKITVDSDCSHEIKMLAP